MNFTYSNQPDTKGLVQNCSNSSALAIDLPQSCTKPSIYPEILAIWPKYTSKQSNETLVKSSKHPNAQICSCSQTPILNHHTL